MGKWMAGGLAQALLAVLPVACVGGSAGEGSSKQGNGDPAPVNRDASADLVATVAADADAGSGRGDLDAGLGAEPLADGGGPPCELPLREPRGDDAELDIALSHYPFCNLPGTPCEEIWRIADCFCDDGRPGQNFCNVGGTYSECGCE